MKNLNESISSWDELKRPAFHTELSKSLISLKNISVIFKDIVALDRVNFDFRYGDFVFLTGPSGAGKSTFLKVIGGLQEVHQGEIVHHLNNLRIGHVFQNLILFSERSIKENLMVSYNNKIFLIQSY